MSSNNHITQFLEKIQAFQVVTCNMHHERVAFDKDRQPLYKKTGDNISFTRQRLCNLTLRKERLGCAHSNANMNFIRLLDDLATHLPTYSNQILRFKHNCSTLITNIYKLDHEKGQLEHNLALCKLTVNLHQEDQLAVISKQLKDRHEQLMEELSVLKSDIELFIIRVGNIES